MSGLGQVSVLQNDQLTRWVYVCGIAAVFDGNQPLEMGRSPAVVGHGTLVSPAAVEHEAGVVAVAAQRVVWNHGK